MLIFVLILLEISNFLNPIHVFVHENIIVDWFVLLVVDVYLCCACCDVELLICLLMTLPRSKFAVEHNGCDRNVVC